MPSHVPAEPLEIAVGTLNGELHKRLLEPGLVTVEQWNEHIAPRFKAVADVILGSSVHARSYRVHESSYPPVGESPWIPVGRRLPTHPYSVFVVIVASAHFHCTEDDPMVDVATYFPDEKAWHINHGDDDVLVTVSLWMDIPPRTGAPARTIAKHRTPAEVAQLAVDVMGDDNGAAFKPGREQLERLAGGIARMMVAGCAFTTAEIELWGAGEHSEMLDAFQRFDGFEQAQQAMVDIFDGLPLLSHDEAPTEIKDLFARNTGDYMPTETEKEAIDNGLAEIMRQLGRPGAPRVLFRPLLTSGLIGNGNAGTTSYVIIDSEQPESEQVIALWHETLHLLGLKDETLVEAMAQRLAQACPEVLPAVKQVAAGA